MSKPILNYTTQIKEEKTLSEIQSALARHGATAILAEYDSSTLSSVSFKIRTPHGIVSFRLPANIDGVFSCLKKNSRVPKRLRTKEQASRVAWRIIKDWILAQLAIVSADIADLEEVFLPYAQLPSGDTLYEHFLQQPKLLNLE